MVQSIYHLSDEQIKNLTLKEFNVKAINLEHVVKLYNPYIGEGDGGAGGGQVQHRPAGTVEDMNKFLANQKKKDK